MIKLNFQEFDKQSKMTVYSIDFDSDIKLETMLNDIQESKLNGKLPDTGTIQIYKSKELYDEPIVEIKYVNSSISDIEWNKIPICILGKSVKYAYLFLSTINDDYHIAIIVK